MRTATERFKKAMDTQLDQIFISEDRPIEQYRLSILVCKKAMRKLKAYISGYQFQDTAEEIEFFKHVKPQFYSRYIYYITVYNFIVQRPAGGEQALKDHIEFHQMTIRHFFDNNKGFYQYYRAGSTHMDEIYYTRGSFNVQMELEDFEEDESYSTSHDYKLSKVIANEKFQDYLQLELAKVGTEELTALGKVFPFKHPQWTASQTDAVELLYALKASASVNNGNIDISELAAIFEFVFQTELRETYHKLLDITRRKKDQFVFLTRLRNSLENLMAEKFK